MRIDILSRADHPDGVIDLCILGSYKKKVYKYTYSLSSKDKADSVEKLCAQRRYKEAINVLNKFKI